MNGAADVRKCGCRRLFGHVLFAYECPVWMLILPSLFRLRTGLRHVVKTTVITRSKGLVSMKNGSHGLECDS
jgi:hypothetical protein